MAELLEMKHEVRLINTEPPESEYVENRVTLRPARVRHYSLLRRKIKFSLRDSPSDPVLWASISPALLGHWRDMFATLPAFQPAQPVYGVVHRATFDGLFRNPLTSGTARRLVHRLSAFVFLNSDLSEACSPWIPERKRTVIPNTIDDAVVFSDRHVEQKREARRSRKRMRLLFLSNMIPLKGYMDVLRAVAILRNSSLSVEAHFVGRWGSAEDRQAFEDFVASEGIGEMVLYHGGINDREVVRQHLELADIFLLPSYHPTEAQPLTLIEALNAGIPIITTNHGGIPYVVRNGVEGLHVAPRSPDAIANSVRLLQNYDTWRELSEGARRRFIGLFAPEVVRSQWEALLEDT